MKNLSSLYLFSAALIAVALAAPAVADSGYGSGGPGTERAAALLLADAGGMITILSPKDGAVLDKGAGNKLEYNVMLSPNGNHIHVYVDDQSPIIDKKVSNCPCSIELPDLASGKHTIVMKEATASHAMTGLQASTTVSVK